MRFWKIAILSLFLCSAARADFLTGVLDAAVVMSGKASPEKSIQSRSSSPLEAGAGLAAAGALSAGGIAGYNMAMTRYQANAVLNTASMLAIVAMSSNGGEGKDMSLDESGLPNEICNVDMNANKNGVVRIVFGADCRTADGKAVRMKAVQKIVQEISGQRATCSENMCRIDMTKPARSTTQESEKNEAPAVDDEPKLEKRYAIELLNESAKLAIMAQAGNAGEGVDTRYAEVFDNEKVLPCKADLFSNKKGVVTLTLGKECSSSVLPKDVILQIEQLGGGRVYCEQNICQIDYSQVK